MIWQGLFITISTGTVLKGVIRSTRSELTEIQTSMPSVPACSSSKFSSACGFEYHGKDRAGFEFRRGLESPFSCYDVLLRCCLPMAQKAMWDSFAA